MHAGTYIARISPLMHAQVTKQNSTGFTVIPATLGTMQVSPRANCDNTDGKSRRKISMNKYFAYLHPSNVLRAE